MNRLIYLLLIAVLAYIGFVMYQEQDIGQVAISFANLSVNTNLVVLVIAILCFMFFAILLNMFLIYVKNNIINFGSARKQRLKQRATLNLSQGLIELAEGRFKQAEALLIKDIKFSDNQLLAYLSAAKVAQQLEVYDRRDEYLRKAHTIAPEADVAIGLTKAELQLAHHQYEQALATLNQLNQTTENHSYILALLANTYNQLEDWERLDELLPVVKKYAQPTAEKLLAFEMSICKGRLKLLTKQLAEKNTAIKSGVAVEKEQTLQDFWRKTPRHLTQLPALVIYYVNCLLAVDAIDDAELSLRKYLDKKWHDKAISLYSQLQFKASNQQLEMVEKWLDKHPHNPYLLLSLGKMCRSLALWGKAGSYLEASIATLPLPQTYLILAKLLEEKMNRAVQAQNYYRKGLQLLAKNERSTPPKKSNNVTMLKSKKLMAV